METTKESLTKQCINNEELYEIKADGINKVTISVGSPTFNAFAGNNNYYFSRKPNAITKIKCEEPIDLTYTQKENIIDISNNDESLAINCQNNSEILDFLEPISSNIPKKRGRKRKILCGKGTIHAKIVDNNANESSQSVHNNVFDFQITERNESEVMKAAETLFSKRTRTLYHWMYPNLPKQQIKLAVANSWEKLENEERQYYVSEVLVRFGSSKCNLIVNPQIGGIKELPPLPDENNYSCDASELRSATSLFEAASASSSSSSLVTPRRHRLGRPPGSKNKKRAKNDLLYYKISNNFQDDPELSKELEQFAINFDNFK